jgi:hypothetical protein
MRLYIVLCSFYRETPVGVSTVVLPGRVPRAGLAIILVLLLVWGQATAANAGAELNPMLLPA